MTAQAEGTIHPYLLRAAEATRANAIRVRAEAALKFEMADERIEERQYDEQHRLRTHRIISRKVFRGESYERYSSLVAQLQDHGASPNDVLGAVHNQLDLDLRAIASAPAVESDLAGSVRRYGEMMPADAWQSVLCMAEDPGDVERLEHDVVSAALPLLPASPLRRFGIIKLGCPPEPVFLQQIGRLPRVVTMADPAMPVMRPEPRGIRTQIADARAMLGVHADMQSLGKDVTLAVLDTGLDLSHPAFARLGADDYRNFTPAEEDDTEGHGTHVASLAAGDDPTSGGRYRGVAPRCHLVVGKVLAGTGIGDLEHVLDGMAWAVFDKRADILSLSIGDGETPANGLSIWTRACEEAFSQGTLVVAAAGNVDPSYPETIMVPGDAPHAVVVGAIDKARQLASFSAQGSPDPASILHGKPDCVAPGVGIAGARSTKAAAEQYPALDGIDALHVQLSGTSMAAPIVAGCTVLLKSKARSLGWEMTAAELRETLLASCQPLDAPGGDRYSADFEVGHGLVTMSAGFDWIEQRGEGLNTAAEPLAPVRTRTEVPSGTTTPRGSLGGRSDLAAPMAPTPQEPVRGHGFDPRPSDAFLSRFEQKVWERRAIAHPVDGVQFRIDAATLAQSFARRFGRVTQFPLVAGRLRKGRLVVAAVCLADRGLETVGNRLTPALDVLRHIAGSDGLDFADDTFHLVGVFSPVGWPESWKVQGASQSNAWFYLVEHHAGTRWKVFGPAHPVADLFDPETAGEKAARAGAALTEQLALPGDQVLLEVLMADNGLDRASIERAVEGSARKWQLIEHRGRFAVQRFLT